MAGSKLIVVQLQNQQRHYYKPIIERSSMKNTERELVTRAQLELAWADSIAAADWYERVCTDESRQRMVEATAKAERLQAEYDRQYEEWVTS